MAAGTLDASTKIYAVRVDAVHADAYRVLGGLGAETKPGEGDSLFTFILSLEWSACMFPYFLSSLLRMYRPWTERGGQRGRSCWR